MNNKIKTIGAIALIIGGLLLAIAMFYIFLKQQKTIEGLRDLAVEQKLQADTLNQQIELKNKEYKELYVECLEKTNQLEGINQAEVAAAAKKAENGQFHIGISWPSLRQAEGLELLRQLKNAGYNIWYENEKTSDLGNMYYYKNGGDQADEINGIIEGLFPRIKLNVKEGGSGNFIPSAIRDNTIIIKI